MINAKPIQSMSKQSHSHVYRLCRQTRTQMGTSTFYNRSKHRRQRESALIFVDLHVAIRDSHTDMCAYISCRKSLKNTLIWHRMITHIKTATSIATSSNTSHHCFCFFLSTWNFVDPRYQYLRPSRNRFIIAIPRSYAIEARFLGRFCLRMKQRN